MIVFDVTNFLTFWLLGVASLIFTEKITPNGGVEINWKRIQLHKVREWKSKLNLENLDNFRLGKICLSLTTWRCSGIITELSSNFNMANLTACSLTQLVEDYFTDELKFINTCESCTVEAQFDKKYLLSDNVTFSLGGKKIAKLPELGKGKSNIFIFVHPITYNLSTIHICIDTYT